MPLVVVILIAVAADPVLLDRPLPALRHGQEFRETLGQPLTATWENIAARSLFRRLADAQGIGILLDCRVDPTTVVPHSQTGQSLEAGMLSIAKRLECGLSLAGNTAYVGPQESADWLRTTIEQHEAVLVKEGGAISEGRKFALFDRKTIHWQDLDTPREILQQIARRYELEIVGLDRVPHDLWASATIPYATAAESLTLVLVQLSLDFEWNADGSAVTIIPHQLPTLIEKRYPPKKSQTAAVTLAAWLEAQPHLQGRVEGQEIVIAGRVEDHERLSGRPGIGDRKPVGAADPVPLRRRRFTLRVENIPVRAILRELEKSGVTFQFDADVFAKAKVNLDTPVSLDVKGVDADEFLKALLGTIGVKFTIDDRTVTLTPHP